MSEEEVKEEAVSEEAVEEEVPEEEPAPKKRRGYKSTIKPITGKIKNDDFSAAIADIQKDSYVSSEQVTEILTQTMEQAYLEWSYPGLFRDRDNDDPAKELIKCEVDFSNNFSKFAIYDIKTVTNEDDIVDDAYQISLEDAQEIKPSAKLGDVIKIKFDVTKLDKTYVRRVKQLFQSKLKEASRAAILAVYQDKIGELIEGTVSRIEPDGNSYELSFGKAQGFLRKNNKLPSDRFVVGDKVLVHLSDVSDKSNPPSLVISRTSREFVEKLLERAVPEIHDGIVVIKACEREPGKRTKIFVDSTNPNIDPVGTCIGPESSRIRSVLNELGNEKIDIARYYMNKALQVIEAMKPATVIGLTCPEDFFDPNVHYEELEQDRMYEYPKITCVVNNGNQGVAIGSSGVNVRLASRITHCTISVLQADDAIAQNLKYMMVNDIQKMVSSLSGEVKVEPAPEASEELSQEEEDLVGEVKNEEVVPNVPEAAPAAEEAKPEETKPAEEEKPVEKAKPAEEAQPETKPVEEVKPEVAEPAKVETPAPAVDPVKAAKEEVKAKETKPEEKPIEHVEIRNKPRISLEELEEAISTKKGPSETKSYKKRWKKNDSDEKKTEETPSEASKVEAMPIYTEEELQQLDQNDQEDDNYEDDIDLDQYDSDKYYDEK